MSTRHRAECPVLQALGSALNPAGPGAPAPRGRGSISWLWAVPGFGPGLTWQHRPVTPSFLGREVGAWQTCWTQLPTAGPACSLDEALGTFPDGQKQRGTERKYTQGS